MESRTRVTGMKVDLPSGESYLFVEIAVDCPACGQYTVKIAGHHLRAIRNALIEMIDLHPDLTGRDSQVKVIERTGFSATSQDPSKN